MSIWFDMTNSMKTWQGTNDAGVVRAELEIAKNLHELDGKTRYFISEEIGFTELQNLDLQWLWAAENISDAYMNRKGVSIKKQDREEANWEIPGGLKEAYGFSVARIDRIRRARELWLYTLQGSKKYHIGKYVSAVPYRALKATSVANAKRKQKKVGKISNSIHKVQEFAYPFKEGDVIFSGGFFGSNKENQFSKLKSRMRNIKIGYLVYDLFYVKKETAAIYSEYHFNEFSKYLEWIANNCDYIVYGGKTAQKDAESYFKKYDLRILDGFPIKFGSEITHHTETSTDSGVLKNLKISEPYILAVGSIIAKKNYNTIYKAYKIMGNHFKAEEIPTLVIVGGKHAGSEELVDVITTDDFTKEKIKLVHATDEELDVLYRNAKFTILPSLYEGWSLTLPESLAYGKFCIASDVAPLREIGGDLIEYAYPLDPADWAEKIMHFMGNLDQVAIYNRKIKETWKSVSWRDCGSMLLDILKSIENKVAADDKILYYDLSLTYYSSFSGASVSGILRTQLLLARYLTRLDSNIKFIAFTPDGCVDIDKTCIAPILSNINIEEAFKQCFGKLQVVGTDNSAERQKDNLRSTRKQAFWMMVSVLPEGVQKGIAKRKTKIRKLTENIEKDYKVPFKKGDLVFSSGAGMLDTIYECVIEQKKKIGFEFVQLIYDFTPTLLPQVHRRETIEFYKPFIKYSALISDVIFYGGETAKRDGIAYAEEHELPIRPGVAIKFGSNIVQEDEEDEEQFTEDTFEKYGIKGKYIMAVGSIEIRKNHETLYQAYLEMMSQSDDIPQMLFCGYPGWKTSEFCAMLARDERVKGKILLLQPSDKELAVLYKNCAFTVLASLYEGWSLTLPESLNYGKFCICTDCAPLKETGKDFIDYVEAYNMKAWASKILHYYRNPVELKKREQYIQKDWHAISWQECAKQVAEELGKIMK